MNALILNKMGAFCWNIDTWMYAY